MIAGLIASSSTRFRPLLFLVSTVLRNNTDYLVLAEAVCVFPAKITRLLKKKSLKYLRTQGIWVEEKQNNSLLWIVAIVAVVGIVAMVIAAGGQSSASYTSLSSGASNSGGDATASNCWLESNPNNAGPSPGYACNLKCKSGRTTHVTYLYSGTCNVLF